MLPEQFLERMRKLLDDEYPAFLQSYQEESRHALHVNARKGTAAEFLKKSGLAPDAVPWAENGFYYETSAQPGKHPFHEAGVYYIQEPSAMAPVLFLGVEPGDRVLDLCAAPGGKSAQIADALCGEGILVSNEIHAKRAAVLSENMERMGVANAIVTNEPPARLTEAFPGYFDRILVDAPCSGEGMFRKNEDACGEWSPENVALCAARQDEILSCAADMLRPGGRMVYSTCTFSPEEDEGSVSRFLRAHPEFHIVGADFPKEFTGGFQSVVWDAAEAIGQTVRLMPHRLRGEGHFFAVLKKDGEAVRREPLCGLQKGLDRKEYAAYADFARRYLRRELSPGTFLRFGEQLYLGPPDMPALKGLKVLRPGLHLGTFKKDRFEPAHALALYLKPSHAALAVDLSAGGEEVLRYLEGQTLETGEETGLFARDGESGEKVSDAGGWCLVCVDGYSLGWGKLAGAVLKNHYPKGLRKRL